MKPRLLTFDIFGTVLDWREGLKLSLKRFGRELPDDKFDDVIDLQGRLEKQPYLTYTDITERSLIGALGLQPNEARDIAQNVGLWPLYEDSPRALMRLLQTVPCVALTNSDRAHGKQVQEQLGFQLSHWLCAEETKLYKPDEGVWRRLADKTGCPMDASWWHVSAYADYDLEVARDLGLTCVFIDRPHSRRGFSHMSFESLTQLADLVEATSSLDLAVAEPGQTDLVLSILKQAPAYYRNVEGAEATLEIAEKEMTDGPSAPKPGYEKIFLLICRGQAAIGVVDLHRNHPSEGTVYLGLLLLGESFHGRGLGRAAYTLVETFCRSQLSATRIVLGVSQDNDAEPFWTKMGFAPNGRTYTWKGTRKENRVTEMEKLL